ncbi:C2 domain [Dillenia turbinata]|uniref:phospholipase D n=1 Tax=Dillenia turbinata TaxID=194707 RepID=A0AAN8UYV1_9MAGN
MANYNSPYNNPYNYPPHLQPPNQPPYPRPPNPDPYASCPYDLPPYGYPAQPAPYPNSAPFYPSPPQPHYQYPYQIPPDIPHLAPQPTPALQHHPSFPQYSSAHYQYQQQPYQYPPAVEAYPPSGPQHSHSFSNHGRQESFADPDSVHDNVDSSRPNYPAVYPQVDNLLAGVHLSEDAASAPAASSAASRPSSPPLKYPSLSATRDDDGSFQGYPNYSFSSNPRASYSGPLVSPPPPAQFAHSHSMSFSGSEHSQSLQIVPFSKGSLRVLLLHGNLDIWVYEAKNLPNMDLFHKTLGDMFGRIPGNVSGKIEGHVQRMITSDPYVSISIANAVIGRTYVISNSENPVWMQHFNVPVAHSDAEVHFVVKDSDVVGAQVMGEVTIPVEQLYSGAKIEGKFPILNNGKPCKQDAVLSLSIQYTPMERLSIYQHGVGSGPDYSGVPGTYFPLRNGGKVKLYQDAHVPEGSLPPIMLDYGTPYVHGKCWMDIFDAIRHARKLIYITGWSIWHKVRLVRDGPYASDCTLGDLLKSKSQEGVRVLLLVWDDPTSRNILGIKTDGVMQTHDEETRRFFKHSSVQVILCPRAAGKRHSWVKQREVETIYTHHQKTVIVDAEARDYRRKIIAFVGGLDLCDGRYDNPQHPIFKTLHTLHNDDYHNPTFTGNTIGCPREPWHDLHCKIDGPAAYDILTNFEERWLKASKPHGIKKVKTKTSYDDALLRIERIPEIIGISESPCISEDDPEAWHVQVFRSIDSNSVKGFPKDPREATSKNLVCGKNVLIDMSIHTAYVKAIRAAQHFIYIENQYFLGSSFNWSTNKDLGANNLIPMEIALKIAEKIRANERFAAYIVIPMWPEGVPTSNPIQRILYWQNKTMQMMYQTIHKALVEAGLEDAFIPQDYLNFFCLGNREADDGFNSINLPVTNAPQALSRKSRRFMIYVHSKGMIVDDEYVIIGSANINQRSMEGTRDTEIAMGAYQPQYTWAKKQRNPCGEIHGYRMSLWAEHTGTVENCFMQPESLECVRRLRSIGEMNWKQFAADEVSEMRGHLLKYPVDVDRKGKVKPLQECPQFPDVGGNICGSFLAIQENLTI